MAATKNAAKAPKFQVILASSGQDVLDRRSQLTFKATEKAMNSHLQQLNDKRDDLEIQILNLTDVSVETRDSLRPGSRDFNPSQWVKNLVSLKMEVALLDEEIAIVEETRTEFFGTSEE